MCGRFTRHLSWAEIVRLYRLNFESERGRNMPARYDIAPTEDVPFVTAGEDGVQQLREGRWRLVPWWAKEMPKQAMFNARVETLETSGAFKDAFRSARCLIPADGFYEWMKNAEDGGRDPWHIFLRGQAPFSFAGLWAHNQKLELMSCTIVTAQAIAPVNEIHDRMPVILNPAAYDSWLNPATSAAHAKALLGNNLDGELQFYRVGRAVNSTKCGVDEPEMIEAV